MSKRSVPFIGSQEQKAGKKCINFVWDQEVIHDVLFCKEGYMVGVWMITIQFGEYARWYKGLRCLPHESEGEAKGGGGGKWSPYNIIGEYACWYSKHPLIRNCRLRTSWQTFGSVKSKNIRTCLAKQNQAGSYMWVTLLN